MSNFFDAKDLAPEENFFDADDSIQEKEEPSAANSALGGFFQGATLGHTDEMEATMGALWDVSQAKLGNRGDISLSDAYRTRLDASRKNYEELQSANPTAYTGAEIAGGIAPAFIPGGAVVAGASKARAGAALAAGGAIAGSGYSEGELGSTEHVLDTTLGGGLALATAGALKGAGKLAKKSVMSPRATEMYGKAFDYSKMKAEEFGGVAGRKAMNVLGGVPDKHVDRYLQRSDQVNAARSTEEVAEAVLENVDKLRDRVVQGSRDSVDLIDDGFELESAQLTDQLDELIGGFQQRGEITKESSAALNELMTMRDKINPGTILEDGSIENIVFSGKDLKTMLKRLDSSIKLSENAGTIADPINAAKVLFRKHIDSFLKQDENYAKHMEEVAKDAQVLNMATKQFKKASPTASKLRIMSMNPDKKIDERRALAALDDRLGGDLLGESDDLLTQRSFTLDSTRGSRGVNLWGAMGAGLGGATGGVPGAMAGASIGAGIGATADKYGTRAAKAILDKHIKNKATQSPRVLEKVEAAMGDLPDKFRGVLENAKARGTLGVVHSMLLKNNDEYKALISGSLRDEDGQRKKHTYTPKIGTSGKHADVLMKAKQRGGNNSLNATHFMLMQTDEAYRQKHTKKPK